MGLLPFIPTKQTVKHLALGLSSALDRMGGGDERETDKKGDGSQKLPMQRQAKKKIGLREEGQCST